MTTSPKGLTTFYRTDNGTGGGAVNRVDYTWTEFLNGTKLPSWRSKVKLGQNATTAYTAEKRDLIIEDGSISLSYRNTTINPFGAVVTKSISGDIRAYNMPWSFDPPTSSSATADRHALRNFYRRIAEVEKAFNGLTFLGELRETIAMVRNPLKTLRTGVDDYLSSLSKRRRGVRSDSKLQSILADTWLEYSFGWSPLLSDLKDGLQACLRLNDKRFDHRISAVGKDEVQVSSSHNLYNAFQGIWVRDRRIVTDIHEVRYFGMVRGQIYTSQVDKALALSGFNLKEFVPTAWELIPYSFLVDYFSNVGEILEASVVNLSNLAYYGRTIRSRRKQAFYGVPDFDKNNTYWEFEQDLVTVTGSVGKLIATYSKVSRDIPSLGIPSLQIELPKFGTKWLNLAALAASHNRSVPYYR